MSKKHLKDTAMHPSRTVDRNWMRTRKRKRKPSQCILLPKGKHVFNIYNGNTWQCACGETKEPK